MKTTYKTLLAALLFTGSMNLASCQGGSEAAQDEQAREEHPHEMVFQCPMKCEEDKTYTEAGSCPVCGMDLEELAAAHDHDDHDHDHEGHSH